MPQRCCVPMCNTIGGHRFPKDPKRRKQWLKAICRDNLISTEWSRVCKSHFLPKDYLIDHSNSARNPRYVFLKKDAVPSVFVWSKNTIFEDKKQEWRKAKYICRKVRKRTKQDQKGNPNEEDNFDVINAKSQFTKDMKKYVKKKKSCTQETKSKPDKLNVKEEMATDVDDTKVVDPEKVFEEAVKTDVVSASEQVSECRACLQQLKVDKLFSLFQGWAPTWDGLGPTIAEDLANLSSVQLSESDVHSKFICHACCEKLWNACHFKMLVQDNDRVLRQRISDDSEKVWPKPIQVDKSINGVYENNGSFNVDIKQEILSDEEVSQMEEGYTDPNLMDIKVEPEEIVEQSPIIVNGVTSLKDYPTEEIGIQLMNGEAKTDDNLEVVKEEPISDVEDTELSLECLLCMRPFHSVSGLKAHVIAQHSYQTVARGDQARARHACATCRRTFTTSTDLMVHETCHNKHVCYGCGDKFDTFANLSLHRKRCKRCKPPAVDAKRPKTLDDVIRPQAEERLQNEDKSGEINTVCNIQVKVESKLFSCPMCSEIFTDMYYVKIHQEVHHNNKDVEVNEITEESPMEVETLESIFNEDI